MTSRLAVGSQYEGNPFSTSFPSSSKMSESDRNFIRAQAESLRKQHNLAQAGDSSFPWQKLNDITDSPLYTRGSLGRFVHPTYGLVFARYVRYKLPGAGLWTGSPVGHAYQATGFTWDATTDIANSAAARVIGIQAGFTVPVDGQYGWVITEGINTQSVRFTNASAPVVGDQLSWNSNGVVDKAGPRFFGTVATIAGLVAIDATHWDLAPASIHLHL